MKIYSKILHINKVPIKVHGISTGQVALKQKALKTTKPNTFTVLKSLFSKEFTEMMPIWVWVIEHPEGNFLIDTGETFKVLEPDFFDNLSPVIRYFMKTQLKFEINRADEIDQQLLKIGLSKDKIDQVILTHIHTDHIDGLKHFMNKPILVNKNEWETTESFNLKLLPKDMKPLLVTFDHLFEQFDKMTFLTKNEDLMLVETPGHTIGHCSIVLQTDEGFVLFAGDTVYHQDQLFEKEVSATVADYKMTLKSCEAIVGFAKNSKVVVLPSHDKNAGERLEKMEFL
jgi:glyoxylase-like metal-dependent hydrolase (beta-lactamase superfamily II)